MTLREDRMLKNLIKQKIGSPKAFICCRIEEYGSQAESSALIISYLLTRASDSSVQVVTKYVCRSIIWLSTQLPHA